MITLQNINKRYDEAMVLRDVSFTIESGEFFVLVGPSGSGKTTVLKLLNRLEEPSSGTVLLNQQAVDAYDVRTLRLSIGYVLQQIALFPNLTVCENIELIPEMKKWPKQQRQQRAKELLDKVGLPADQYAKRLPHELSGGEQQRVGILRAIIAEPQVLLMDEPFSALDPLSRKQLQELIKELHTEFQMTVVFVTHDMQEALYLGDRICVMRHGQVVQLATPQEIQQQPANAFVAQFFETKGVRDESFN